MSLLIFRKKLFEREAGSSNESDRNCRPTAVGKTSLSIELAKQFNGEIISGDSMQVYRGLDIGTAKVTAEEMEEFPTI